ncbi:putative EG45-like domain containing protein 1 [Capsicum galapagoense]
MNRAFYTCDMLYFPLYSQAKASTCSVPSGSFVARVAYLGSTITCGDTLKVKCTGTTPPCTSKSITVKVVDHCKTCRDVTMVLSQAAISIIANPVDVKSVIRIDYDKI